MPVVRPATGDENVLAPSERRRLRVVWGMNDYHQGLLAGLDSSLLALLPTATAEQMREVVPQLLQLRKEALGASGCDFAVTPKLGRALADAEARLERTPTNG